MASTPDEMLESPHNLADLGHTALRYGKSGEMLCGGGIIRGISFLRKKKG